MARLPDGPERPPLVNVRPLVVLVGRLTSGRSQNTSRRLRQSCHLDQAGLQVATAHSLHNAMVEEPSRVVLTAKLAMELMR